jgi:hypothetical protein
LCVSKAFDVLEKDSDAIFCSFVDRGAIRGMKIYVEVLSYRFAPWSKIRGLEIGVCCGRGNNGMSLLWRRGEGIGRIVVVFGCGVCVRC